MSPTINDAENLALVSVQINKIIEQEWESMKEDPYTITATSPEIFNQLPWSDGAYSDQVLAPVGLFSVTAELENNDNDRIVASNKRTVYPLDFTKDINMSSNWFDDNHFDLYSKTTRGAIQAAYITQNQTALGIFRGAFTSTITNDATPLIGNHPLIKGGTFSNMVPNNPALSDSSLDLAKNIMRSTVNQSNVKIGLQPKVLVVPIELHSQAMKIVDSPLVAGSNLNDISVWKNVYGLKVMTSPYLSGIVSDVNAGSSTAWFLLASPSFHTITRLIRQGLRTDLVPPHIALNRSYRLTMSYRENYFVSDYWGVVGSRGDGLA